MIRNHSRHGSRFPITLGGGGATDPYWPFVSMLLHGDGTNAAQNNTFLDGSTNNFTVTRNGNTTQGSFNPFVSTYPYAVATNGGSGYFDGTGQSLSVPANVAFNLSTSDFTIEYWIYLTASNAYINSQSDTGVTSLAWYQQCAAGVITSVVRNSSNVDITCTSSAGAIVVNTWYHVAFVRNGNTTRQYINGVQNGTGNVTGFTVRTSTGPINVGNLYVGSTGDVKGYISNFRLVNGTCLYPSGTTFTPPTAPLTAVTNTALLLGMSNGAIYDNTMLNNLETVADAQISTSVFKYGTGSMKFNGTTDYLPTPDKVAFTLGANDFTVEAWIYATTAAQGAICGQTNAAFANANTSIVFSRLSDGRIDFFAAYNSSSSLEPITTLTAPLNTWTHVAAVRDGATLRVYVGGVQSATATISTGVVNDSASSFAVGRPGDFAGQYFQGYIDDFRFTKGICRYPSGTTFTPPTAAFPNS